MTIYAATNQLASPVAYEIPPRELFEIFRWLRARELQLVGIYHSHPHGDNSPSARDLEQAYYPEAAYVIVVPRLDTPAPVRAFRLAGKQVHEIAIEVTS
jgi:proteasome lid subunit RPN8/RPN11